MKKIALCYVLSCMVSFMSGINVSYSSNYKVTYEKDIKTLIETKCFKCHGSNAPTLDEFRKDSAKYLNKGLHVRLDTYEYLMVFVNGEDLGGLQNRLDDGKNLSDGKPGSMYVYLGDDDKERAENLKLFKDWIGHWNVKTIHEIEKENEEDWLSELLIDDNDAEYESIEKILDDMRKKIKAPKQ